MEETIKAVSKLANGKAPGIDSRFKFVGCHLQEMLTAVIQKIWEDEVMPKDWNDAVTEVVFKGQKDECNNFRRACLLAAAVKALSRIVLHRLQIFWVNEILLESLSGSYKKVCGTAGIY